jgi:VRR-NUC domain
MKKFRATNHFGENESTLIQKVIAFLSMNGYTAWRQHNSGVISQDLAVVNIIKYLRSSKTALDVDNDRLEQIIFEILSSSYGSGQSGLKGVSDILGFSSKTGQMIAVEVKIGKDKLSPAQEKFRDNLTAAGGRFIEAKYYQQFLHEFRNPKALKKETEQLLLM